MTELLRKNVVAALGPSHDLEDEIGRGDTLSEATSPQLGNRVGGDRDGNPFVTP